ncbi:MAG: protein translocase subunit SecD [Parasporobacterium sp.]|nr:protein translocase subunit SecD [Parasporobacterium sp.]
MRRTKHVIIFIIAIIVIIACCLVAGIGFGGGHIGAARNITLGLDLRGGVSVTYQTVEDNPSATDMADTIYKLQMRVQQYSTDATVYQEGTNRITVEIPGVYDTQTVIEELGRPGSLQFVTYDQTTESGAVDYDNPTVWVAGTDIANAQAGSQSDQRTGSSEFVVQLQLTPEGAEKFADATAQYLNQIIYIVYDGEVVSSPRVQSVISDGNCIIEGMESYEAAATLASTIRIGSLNLELEEVSSKVVSAKLGDNAISTSLIAGLIGILLIMIFMIIYFRVPGLAAALAMVFYTAAILLLLNAFNLTLTISGIAGIILTIGMAVDGNVIINARIKEELNAGYSVEQSIKNGFKKSTSAILDGNITTLIVAIVLMIFGSGTVNGFGMTLAIGIVLSVITSLLVTRILMFSMLYMGLSNPSMYATALKEKKTPFDFVGKRVITFCIAAVCIVAGIIAMIANGASGNRALNMSIEFVGGVSTTVDFPEDVSIDTFNNEIKPAIAEVIGSNDIEGQKVTGSTQYVIKTQDLDVDTREQMQTLLEETYGADPESFETTYISSTVSTELLRDAYVSLIIAAVLMLLYIWIRFRKFKFAISSVICLLHDVLIVIAFFAIFRMSVGNSFIACILTIVGYSINATIVIFDRIRENLADTTINHDLKYVINRSISQSMSRSILTSATTFVTVLFLYILGVESMKAFALPLAVGIIAGAFSSVLIAGSLFYILHKKEERVSLTKIPKAAAQVADGAAAAAATAVETVETAKKKITANPNHKKKKRKQ